GGSENGARGPGMPSPSARSARTSPSNGPNLNACPEQPPPTTRGPSRSSRKSSSAVIVYRQVSAPSPAGSRPGRRPRTYADASASSAGSSSVNGPSRRSPARPGLGAATLTPGAPRTGGPGYQHRPSGGPSIRVGHDPARGRGAKYRTCCTVTVSRGSRGRVPASSPPVQGPAVITATRAVTSPAGVLSSTSSPRGSIPSTGAGARTDAPSRRAPRRSAAPVRPPPHTPPPPRNNNPRS